MVSFRRPTQQRTPPVVVEANNLGRSLQGLLSLLQQGVTIFDLAAPLRKTLEILQQAVVVDVITATTNTTLDAAMPRQFVKATGGVTVTLPAAAKADGNVVVVKKTGAGASAVTVSGTIDGGSSVTITQQNRALAFTATSSGWSVTEAYWPKALVADVDATGTPDATTFLRGDGAWAEPPVFSGWTVVSVTGSTTLTPSTTATLVQVNGTGITLSFAAASSHTGRQIAVNNIGANSATVNGVTLAAGAYATWIASATAWRRVG